jgi:hypothetical protein
VQQHAEQQAQVVGEESAHRGAAETRGATGAWQSGGDERRTRVTGSEQEGRIYTAFLLFFLTERGRHMPHVASPLRFCFANGLHDDWTSVGWCPKKGALFWNRISLPILHNLLPPCAVHFSWPPASNSPPERGALRCRHSVFALNNFGLCFSVLSSRSFADVLNCS